MAEDAPQKPPSGCAVFGGLVVLVLGFGLVWNAVTGGGEDGGGGEDREYGAFDVCQQFVKDRLRSPASAEFRNFFEDDGEVVVTGTGDGPYTVRSSVDSQNGFGAMLRSDFTCTVSYAGDSDWRLVDLSLD